MQGTAFLRFDGVAAHLGGREVLSPTSRWRAALLLGACEGLGRRAAALGSEALAPPSAALKALVGAAMDGSLW